ncbi:MAG: sodium-dependent bicarbonate transport family permease, partial [Bacilli bacterium]
DGLGPVFKEAFFGKSIFLLVGGMFIGFVSSKAGLDKIQLVFGDMFYGILCIFLLHMGMMAAGQFGALRSYRITQLTFTFVLPLIGGTLGVVAGTMIGMSPGGAFMLGTLTGSASYIAAPASVSHAIPEANTGLYLGSSLGLTLPFNLIAGLPLYYWIANLIA